jgi:hypothetical protein
MNKAIIALALFALLISAPGVLAGNLKVCVGDELITTEDVTVSGVVLTISTNETCANGCYDNMNYLGAGCAPVDFELALYAIAIVFLVIGGFVALRRGL